MLILIDCLVLGALYNIPAEIRGWLVPAIPCSHTTIDSHEPLTHWSSAKVLASDRVPHELSIDAKLVPHSLPSLG